MQRFGTSSIRKSAASKFRSWAEQLEPRDTARRRPSAAPLVRLGGRWWQRDEIGDGRYLEKRLSPWTKVGTLGAPERGTEDGASTEVRPTGDGDRTIVRPAWAPSRLL